MRVLKRFEQPALELAAEVAPAQAEQYLGSLVEAGLIRVDREHDAADFDRYTMAGRPGPEAPILTAAQVNRAGGLKLADFAIPSTIEQDGGWGAGMRDLAQQIGPYATLLMCDVFGGQSIYFPRNADQSRGMNRIVNLIDDGPTRALCQAFGGRHVAVPKASTVLARARRAVVLSHARAGNLAVASAAAILGVTRNYAGRLINHTDEGLGVEPTTLPLTREQRLLNEAATTAADRLGDAGVGKNIIEHVTAGIVLVGRRCSQEEGEL